MMLAEGVRLAQPKNLRRGAVGQLLCMPQAVTRLSFVPNYIKRDPFNPWVRRFLYSLPLI
jgi:hypothetical protein